MNTFLLLLVPFVIFSGSIVVILFDAFSKDSKRKSYLTTLSTLIAATVVSFFFWNKQGSAFGGMIVQDSFSLTATLIFILAAIITVLLAEGSPEARPQLHCLILLTLLGMILLVAGTHFLILFIGLEILSLSVYILAAFAKRNPLSSESGLKYFLLGSFASAFFLYGMAFIYGATGTLQLNRIAEALQSGSYERIVLTLGIIFLLVGYGFKISLAPFHMWTPDVYEGAPTAVTTFMAATVKAAALASLIRVFVVAFPSVSYFWIPIIWAFAVVTMFAGNASAIVQDNLKRLLAYSSIAHAGYMLLGLLATPEQAEQTILYYFAVYAFMTLGVFTIVAYLERTAGILTISEYAGLAYSRPILAVSMTVFLVSLGGIPPTAGFFGKFYLFRAVLDSGYVWAVVIAVLNSAVSFYYYLRVVISMFTPEKEVAVHPAAAVSLPILLILAITLWGTITLGLFPNFFLEISRIISIVS